MQTHITQLLKLQRHPWPVFNTFQLHGSKDHILKFLSQNRCSFTLHKRIEVSVHLLVCQYRIFNRTLGEADVKHTAARWLRLRSAKAALHVTQQRRGTVVERMQRPTFLLLGERMEKHAFLLLVNQSMGEPE
jgi:hypothetical protein